MKRHQSARLCAKRRVTLQRPKNSGLFEVPISVLACFTVQYCLGPGAYAASPEKVIYSFGINGPDDGSDPEAGLVDLHGTLYGTTRLGGVRAFGTVFAITTAGSEGVIYSFGNCIRCTFDGWFPTSTLLNVSGTFYGTTYEATGNQYGTVFSITPGGVENLVTIFPGAANPLGGLTYAGGVLYFTTSAGGGSIACQAGCGTVSAINPVANEEKVLVAFPNGHNLATPISGLLHVGGTLYGTTAGLGYGGVFKVTAAGNEATVYTFQSGTDGAVPMAGLINVNGTLYGTTSAGGGSSKCQGGCGTVFKVTRAGKETVIHAFAGGVDGAAPLSNLLNVGGTLYGTTSAGGGSGCGGVGCGTVFKIAPNGAETIEHAFRGFPDGATPMAGLIKVGAKLYGTTASGGASTNCPNGCGTVFEVAP